MTNPNHPAKGSTIKVEPIRSLDAIQRIKRNLADNPRNLAIFTIGINSALRASDLVRLTVGQVKHLQAGEHFRTVEKKTGKGKDITVNNSVVSAVQNLLVTMPDAPDSSPLFISNKTGKALTEVSLTALVKTWCKTAKLKGNYGSHTLRKTFGYMHRTEFNTDIPTLMTMFNHATQKQTLDYLGIQAADIQAAYLKEL